MRRFFSEMRDVRGMPRWRSSHVSYGHGTILGQETYHGASLVCLVTNIVKQDALHLLNESRIVVTDESTLDRVVIRQSGNIGQ